LLDKKKIKSNRKARVLHNLGMSSFLLKQNDQALIYFSKLITDYPKSHYNKNGLLFLGKSFKKLNQKEQAKQTFSELVSRFPKSKQTKEAKKILKKL